MAETKRSALGLMDPNLERTFRGHKSYVTSVAFSPSLKQLASGSGDNTVMLWNFKPQLRAFKFIGHKGVVTDVKFSPEGDVLASASKDKTVRIWVPSAKGESVTMKGHAGAVRSVDFSSDSRHLITASDDKTAKVWSLPSRKFSASLVGHSNWVRTAAFDQSVKLAVTGSDDKQVKVWDVATRQVMHTFYDHDDVVNCVQFLPDSSCVASGSADRTIKMWDIRSRQLIQHYGAHTDSVTSISMHNSGYYMVSTSRDSSIKIWDLREGRLLFTLQGHVGAANAAAFSPDGNFFASGGADQMVMVWRANLMGSGIEPTPYPISSKESKPYRSSSCAIDTLPSRLTRDSTTATSAPSAATASFLSRSHSPLSKFGSSDLSVRPKSGTVRQREPTSSSSSTLIPPFSTGRTMPHSQSVQTARTDSSRVGPRSPSHVTRSSGITTSEGPRSPSSVYARAVKNQKIPVKSSESIGDHGPGPSIPVRKTEDDRSTYVNRDQLPEALAGTLDHIIGQLDIITRTISILENRLTLTEDRISTIIAYTRGLGEVPVSNPGHVKTSAYLEFERTDRDRFSQTAAGSTINNINVQAVSGTKQGSNQKPQGSHYNSKLFDDRSYDEIQSSNFLRNEDSFLKNLGNDVSSLRNILKPEERFAKIVPSTRNDYSPTKNIPQHDTSSPRNVPRGSDWMHSSSLRAMQQEDECGREEKRQSSAENMGYYYSDNYDMPYVGKKSPAFPRTRSNILTMQEQSFNDEQEQEQEEEEEVGQGEEEFEEEEEEENEKSVRDKQITVEHEISEEVHSSATCDNKDNLENEDEYKNDEDEDDQDEPLEVGQYADSESGDEYYTQEGEDQLADDDGEENTYEAQEKVTAVVRADGGGDALIEKQ